MTIRHVFLWSVADGADGQGVLDELSRLPELVPGVSNWAIGAHIGKTTSTSDEPAFEYALTCDFDDVDGLDAYQNHPLHREILHRVMPSYGRWAVVDVSVP